MDLNTISAQFSSIEERVAGLPGNISLFVNETANFADEAKVISKRWRETSLMLSKHTHLLEFLEIPQMMDTCVRNGCYEEALKLDSYVQRLSRKHGESVPLVQHVAKEIKIARDAMVVQLVKELHLNVQLPQCLRIIGHLRRVECFSEIELKLKFLSARDAWLQSLLKDIPNTTPLFHLSKLIEINRVNLFDIATQYRAVFPPDDIITSTNLRGGYGGISVKAALHNHQDFNDSTILSSWLSFKIEQFLASLKRDLMACITGENFHPFDTIIDPCFYFGLSMSRIGADIRPQLVSAFNEAVIKRFQLSTKQAAVKLEASLDDYTLQDQQNSSSLTRSDKGRQPGDPVEGDNSSLRPPQSLVDFKPLAAFSNDISSALNEIRQVTGLSIAYRLREALDSSLLQATFAIRKYCKQQVSQGNSASSPSQRDDLGRFCDQFVNHLLPFCQRGLDALCPSNAMAKMIGISLMEMNKLQARGGNYSFTELSISRMKNELSDLLPQSEVPASAAQSEQPEPPPSELQEEEEEAEDQQHEQQLESGKVVDAEHVNVPADNSTISVVADAVEQQLATPQEEQLSEVVETISAATDAADSVSQTSTSSGASPADGPREP